MRRLMFALLAGGALGVIVVGALFVATSDNDPKVDDRSSEQLLDDFIETWSKWRGATAVYEERLERTDTEGTVVYVEIVEVTSVGEDSLTVSETAGSVFGGIDGEGISCRTDPEHRECFVEGEYEGGDALQAELDAMRQAVEGGTHRLSFTGDDCWRIRRQSDIESPVWGDQFDVCFDADSGVATSEVTDTGLGIDTVVRTVKRTDVTIDDLRALID